MQRIDAIVEARMTSSRLPGKVLLPGCGKPMLHHMVERLRFIPELSSVIIATTTNKEDDCIVELAKKLGVLYFRGSEEDVLGRVTEAARHFNTDVIVEITGDDPLVDPQLSSKVINTFLQRQPEIDFVTNDLKVTFPHGFNTRVFSTKLLEQVEKKTRHPVDREHVVNYICKHPDEFRILNIEAEGPYRRPELRLTIDTKADYEVIKAIFDNLYPQNPAFGILDIYQFLDANPHIRDINRNIVQRTYEY